MFGKAVAAVALVVVRTSGISCRAGAIVHSPLSQAIGGSSDSLFDETATRNNKPVRTSFHRRIPAIDSPLHRPATA